MTRPELPADFAEAEDAPEEAKIPVPAEAKMPSSPPAKVPSTPAPKAKSYMIEREIRVNLEGGLTTLRAGKIIADNHYDIPSLVRQGVALKEV